MSRTNLEGIGLGFRQPIAEAMLGADLPELRWVEVHPENYVARGGLYRANLERALAKWPVVTHGLTLGFGSVEPFERAYTGALRDFLREHVRTPWHSEHLCFSAVDGVFLHDLLPLPLDRESVRTVAARYRELREAIETPLAIENISFYAHAGPEAMSELEFLLEVLDASDASLLLDVNNVFVNSRNHGFDPREFIDHLPMERVVQLHIAGHLTRDDGLIIDTHAEPIRDEVFDLFEYTIRRKGPVPVLLERDANFPPFDVLADEVRRLDARYRRALEAR